MTKKALAFALISREIERQRAGHRQRVRAGDRIAASYAGIVIPPGVVLSAGGLAYVISRIALSLLPERKPEELRFRLWCDPWWFATLLTLFSVYWIGRKIGGLV